MWVSVSRVDVAVATIVVEAVVADAVAMIVAVAAEAVDEAEIAEVKFTAN